MSSGVCFVEEDPGLWMYRERWCFKEFLRVVALGVERELQRAASDGSWKNQRDSQKALESTVQRYPRSN